MYQRVLQQRCISEIFASHYPNNKLMVGYGPHYWQNLQPVNLLDIIDRIWKNQKIESRNRLNDHRNLPLHACKRQIK